MHANIKVLLFSILAGLLGLVAGYFIFHAPAGAHTHVNAETSQETWTCSMHPQIRQDEPGKCPICGMDLIPLSEGSTSNPLIMEMTPEAVQLANIQTEEVGSGVDSPGKSVSLTGKVQADERLAASQVAHIPGRIEKLYVSFTGERIAKGQKLADIYSPELVSAQKELIEALKWSATQPQLLEAAREKLRNWKISDDAIRGIEQNGAVQSVLPVFADQEGVVLKRRIAVGDYVREGAVLFDLANLSRLWLLFDAYEEDLAHIRIGDAVTYTVPALPGRSFQARITYIDPVIQPQTRTASLRAEVLNPQGLLKPEMFVRGNIRSGSEVQKEKLSVPKTAVLWTGKRSVVYREIPDAMVPSYEFQEIILGEATGDRYIVEEGLAPGDRIVVNGAFVIDAAAQLNNMASMMNRQIQDNSAPMPVPDFADQTPQSFRMQLQGVVDEYLSVKDALVAANTAGAKESASAMLEKLKQVDMGLLEGKAHQYWMSQVKALNSHGDQLQKSPDIEAQRLQFSYFSNALVQTLQAFGAADTLYLQHCPMAFDNAGADWVSNEKAIRNPYFGDKMLTCGAVKEVFPRED